MSVASSESIFVSIASYRDNQCQYTIQDLFSKAKHPERVVVGVCFQVAKEDEDSFLLDLGPWYLETAIVDKNPFVASSALVCGVTLH
ncbi:unnamed protein product, partial [Polarella glacialis]